MKTILRNYYFMLLLILLAGLIGKSAFAAELKVHYHCTSDKYVSFETAEGPLTGGQELFHSPEPGKSLNLTVGRFPTQYMFWIRQPYGQTKRFASVFTGSKMLPERIDLGEEGHSANSGYSFQLRDGNELINAHCEIEVE